MSWPSWASISLEVVVVGAGPFYTGDAATMAATPYPLLALQNTGGWLDTHRSIEDRIRRVESTQSC